MNARPLLLAALALAAACSKPPEPPQGPPITPPLAQPEDAPRELPPELAGYRAAIEASRLDVVRIAATRRDDTSRWASKLLGQPYLPRGTAWPTDPDGVPLALLAQINFADVPPLPGYPERGILQFYIHGGQSMAQAWGSVLSGEKHPLRYFASLQDPRYFRVLYHPRVEKDGTRLDLREVVHPADWLLPVRAEAQLSFTRATEPVLVTDYRFARVFGTDVFSFFGRFGARDHEVANAYERYSYRYAVAKIGGYGLFAQRDPRLARPDEDWLVLLGIESADAAEHGVEILWGDAGVANFLIRRDDLARRDFSRVAYYWDTH